MAATRLTPGAIMAGPKCTVVFLGLMGDSPSSANRWAEVRISPRRPSALIPR